MKIVIVGAAGDIGQAACKELKSRHEIITVGRSSGDYQLDIADNAQCLRAALWQMVPWPQARFIGRRRSCLCQVR